MTANPWPTPESESLRGLPGAVKPIVWLGAWAALTVVVSLALRVAGMHVMVLPGESMKPTITPGDSLLVDATPYGRSRVGRGDIVIVTPELDNGREVFQVKRLIAIEGDTISCCDPEGRVLLNEAPLDESYVNEIEGLGPEEFDPVAVAPGGMFLMGDNRSRSFDSRAEGPLDERYLHGRVLLHGDRRRAYSAWFVLAAAGAAIVLFVPLLLTLRRRPRRASAMSVRQSLLVRLGVKPRAMRP